MKNLLSYFKSYYLVSFLGPLFKLAEAILELMVPIVVAMIIDRLGAGSPIRTMLPKIGLLIMLGLGGLAFAASAQYFAAKSATAYTRQLNQALFLKVLSLSQSQIDHFGGNSLINRLTSDTLQIQTGINLFFRLILRSPFIVLGAMGMAMTIYRPTWIFFLLLIALLAVVLVILLNQSNRYFHSLRQEMDDLLTIGREQILGQRVIRAFSKNEDELESFKKQQKVTTRAQIIAYNCQQLANPFTYVIVNTILILLMWQGGRWLEMDLLSQGQLVALINYLLQILVELVKFVMVVSILSKSWTSAKRVNEILSFENQGTSSRLDLKEDSGSLVKFENVSFSFHDLGKETLENIHLTLNPGECLGVIGPTGAGKSTFIDLLTEQYQPTKGQIRFNLAKEDHRPLVALVPQVPRLFQGTIRENFLLANPQMQDHEMIEALKIAQAESFVFEKEGLDTQIAPLGKNFSGGQRQRLNIARALGQNAQILVFDDATSALDYGTEAKVFKGLLSMPNKPTLLIVSQRTKNVQLADRILVLDEGRQVGLGTHQELLDTCQVYQEIHASQFVEGVTPNVE